MKIWYLYALVSLLLLGSQRFLYKVAVEKKHSTPWTTFSFMATVTVLSALLFISKGAAISSPQTLLFISLVNSGAFLLGTVTHMEALKYLPTHTVYTVIRMNIVVVVLLSLLIFKDSLSFFQVIGIMVAIWAMLMLTGEGRRVTRSGPDYKRGMIYAATALLSGAAAAVSSKFAALYTEKSSFMMLSYFFGTIGALGINRLSSKKQPRGEMLKSLPLGIVMGLLNFAGFYAFLGALSQGPLSVIAPIASMHFVIAILLSAAVYKEKISRHGTAAVLLAVLAIVLLRIS